MGDGSPTFLYIFVSLFLTNIDNCLFFHFVAASTGAKVLTPNAMSVAPVCRVQSITFLLEFMIVANGSESVAPALRVYSICRNFKNLPKISF